MTEGSFARLGAFVDLVMRCKQWMRVCWGLGSLPWVEHQNSSYEPFTFVSELLNLEDLDDGSGLWRNAIKPS